MALRFSLCALRQERAAAGFPVASEIGGSADRGACHGCRRAGPHEPAYDRDGVPRYDYVALPFEGDFLPSLPVRAAAAYLGVAWRKVALALGVGVHIGDRMVPTDRAMRLLINYRGPPRTFPSFSFADLLAGRMAPKNLSGRVVLIGASFTGSGDSYAQPFSSTQMPGVERLANIIDTIISRDFIGTPSGLRKIVEVAAVLVMAAMAGTMTEFLPRALRCSPGRRRSRLGRPWHSWLLRRMYGCR